MALTQVKTSGIADDAVTLAKQAGGTDGQIITYDASGNPSAVGPGTDGQVLTSTGAGSPPAFETPAAGGISDIVSDTSPQLGGDLDTNSFEISLDDSHKVKFGYGNDLQIYHNGSSGNYIDSVNKDLYLRCNLDAGITGGDILLQPKSGEDSAIFRDDGAVELYYDNTKTFETVDNGIKVVAPENNHASIHMWADDGDDSGDKWQIMATTQGQLRFYHGDSSENTIVLNGDGAVELYHNNVKSCYTAANSLAFNDDRYLKFGTGADIQIWYDGTNYYTYAANEGHIKTQFNSANGSWEVETTAGEHRIQCPSSGTATSVRLFWNGSQKIETTTSGCTVTGSVNETSDIALKENIQPLSNSLANLKQLNGYSYKFKDTEKETGVKSLGLTAQEVEKIYPDLVEGEEGSKTLQYSGLIAPLLEAIKELSTELETLKTKVVALEAA